MKARFCDGDGSAACGPVIWHRSLFNPSRYEVIERLGPPPHGGLSLWQAVVDDFGTLVQVDCWVAPYSADRRLIVRPEVGQ
jgi:hypothetical protein